MKRLPMNEVAELIRGVTYKKQDASTEPGHSLVPLLRATNIGRALSFDDLVYVPEDCVKPAQVLRAGDIVIAASSGSRSVVGKAAVVRSDGAGTFGAFCFALRPDSEVIDPIFLGYYLQTTEYRSTVSALAAGSNINNLKRGHIESLEVPVPDKAVQRSIVSALDSYFSRLDDAVANLERVQRNLKRYRASVLKAAVEGRLVPTEAELARAEGRDYEPASVLLERILAERRRRWEEAELEKMLAKGKPPKNDKWKAKYTEPAEPDLDGLPELPEGWCWATLDVVVEVLDRLRVPINAKERASRQGSVPYYGATGQVGWIDDYLFDEELLLLGEDGVPFFDPYKPKAYVVQGRSWVNNHAHVLRVLADMRVNFWKHALDVTDYHGAVSGTTRLKLSQAPMRKLPVPLPPLEEQRRIEAAIERQVSVIESTTRSCESEALRIDALRSSLLRSAFSGQLAISRIEGRGASTVHEPLALESVAPVSAPESV